MRIFKKLICMSAVAIAIGGGAVFAAGQDKYSVSVPKGLGFADFRGYEAWQTVALSQTGDTIEVIVGDPAMIAAFQAGYPGNGKPFPDGVRMAKIHWKAKKSDDAPAPTTVSGELHDIDFMMKDAKRFADSKGWGYAQFNYDAKADSFSPLGSGTTCGAGCHNLARKKDYVFTTYARR